MNERLVLNTHVRKMLVDGDRFARRVLGKIDSAARNGGLFIAAVTVWELAMLVTKGLIKLNTPRLAWISQAVHASRVIVHPLEPQRSQWMRPSWRLFTVTRPIA
ncbi:hypothetical protein ACFL5O_05365 [Myxococcota bacterium]